VRVTVRVPATSANLGPGFDCFGLALDLSNEVVADTEAEPGVTWEGEGAGELAVDGSDLVSRTVVDVAAGMGVAPPSCAIHGVNRIPLERGLGSSSAAAVAGVVLASVLLGLGWEHDGSSVFAAAARIEGHPDNAAPAVFGGFTLALPGGFVRRLEPHPDLRPVLVIPPHRSPTTEARDRLPTDVHLADAVFNVAHAALMVEAMCRDPSLLSVALEDRLHERARLALVPEVDDRFRMLRRAHVPVCVSGAGPSLLAFEQDGGPEVSLDLLDVSTAWRIVRPGIRRPGFQVEGSPGHP
jgi:homoserine kinase